MSPRLRRNPVVRRLLAGPIHARRWWLERDKRAFLRAYERQMALIEGGYLDIRVPNLEGVFRIDARSTNARRILREHFYEPHITTAFEQCLDPNRDVIDVGANVGFLAVFAAKRLKPGRRLLAVEPTPRANELLRHNVEANGMSERVEYFDGVVSDETDRRRMLVFIEGKEEYSSLEGIVHDAVAGLQRRKIEVPETTIDDLVQQRSLTPGLIKIDTEGHEAAVLAGAAKTLENHHPALIMELDDAMLQSSGKSARGLAAELEALGYTVEPVGEPGQPIPAGFTGEVIARP
ncbi:MAG: FkbM family methyltransferase [Opitutales bacterium]